MANPNRPVQQKSQRSAESAAGEEQRPADERLDLNTWGVLKEIMERFHDRLLQEAEKAAGPRRVGPDHLEQAYRLLLSGTSGLDWSILNRRRVYLIRKKVAGELSPDEQAELADLQAAADRYISAVAPRPLESLWELKRDLERRGSKQQPKAEPD